MKILITGANGQLGAELRRQLQTGACSLGSIPEKLRRATVLCTDCNTDEMHHLDISNRHDVAAFVRHHQPDAIINCAAYTNVDGCEANRELAFRVNAIGARNAALAADEINAKLIHVSTDYVFSGAENGGIALDEAVPPHPISAYGETKLLGEEYVRTLCKRSFIVRTAWLYGLTGKNFVFTIMNAAQKSGRLTVVNDQLGNPTNAEDLAYHLLKMLITKEYGLYHCTGQSVCSWYDFASEIVRLCGIQAEIVPCTSEEYAQAHPEAACRPAWSALENRMLACTIGNDMRPWQNALESFFQQYQQED